MSTADKHLSFRARCLLLQNYPLQHVNIWQRLDDQVSDQSPFRSYAHHVERYEEALSKKQSLEFMLLRAMLGDPKAQTYASLLTPKLKDRIGDTIAVHLCQYRILDFEIGCLDPSRALTPRIPQKIKAGNFDKRAYVNFLRCLKNWRSIVKTFVDLVDPDEISPQDVVVNLKTQYRRSFGHLQCLSDGYTSVQLEVIVQNFRAASFHLTLLQETTISPNALPDIPLSGTDGENLSLSLPKVDIDKYNHDTQEKIRNYIKAHKPAELRNPLHMSLLITMLVLTHPVDLVKTAFPRSLISPLSIAIGNQKPPILVSVEREIWQMLLRISQDSSRLAVCEAFKAIVKSDVFLEVLNLPPTDPVFSFFDPDAAISNEIDDMSSRQIPTMSPLAEEHIAMQAHGHGHTSRDVGVPPGADVHFHPYQDEVMLAQAPKHVPLNDERNPPPVDHDGDINMNLCNDSLQLDTEKRHGKGTSAQDAEGQTEVSHPQLQNMAGGAIDVDADEEEDPDAGRRASMRDVAMVIDTHGYRCIKTPDSRRQRADESDSSSSSSNKESDSLTRNEGQMTSAGARRSTQSVKFTAPVVENRIRIPQVPTQNHLKQSSAIVKSQDKDEESAGASSPVIDAWIKLEEDVFVEAPELLQFNADQASPPLHVFDDDVVAHGPGPQVLTFRPIAHHAENLELLDSIIQLAKEGFRHQKPLHLADDKSHPSVFRIFKQAEFDQLDDLVVQNILRQQHIVVTERQSNSAVTFKQALQRLAPLHRVTEFQDQSLAADAGPQPGKVMDLLNASSSITGHANKILNALSFPNYQAATEPTSYSSDSHALSRVIGQEGWLKRAIPVEDIRWGLACTAGAFHRWHIDSDGFGTFVEPIAGAKWWFVARPVDDLVLDAFNTTGLLLDDRFDLTKSGKGLFAVEAILLQPGSMLIMRPNTLHAVYSPLDSVCRGGHYYSTSTMCDTFVGLVHTFVCDKYITNISHFPSRFILAEMINFFHSGIVKGEIDSSDPASAHIPDLSKVTDFIDLLVTCAMGALMNVLSFQTYLAPGSDPKVLMDDIEHRLWYSNDVNALPEEDRKLLCLTRGQAFEIIVWLNANFRIHNSDNETPHKLFSSVLVNLSKMILHYKLQADNDEVCHNPNFTLDKIQVQLSALLSMSFIGCDDPNAKTWKLPLYNDVSCPMLPDMVKNISLEAIPGVLYTRLSLTELFKSGETVLDRRFARGWNVKQEHIGSIVVDLDNLQQKKRKRDT